MKILIALAALLTAGITAQAAVIQLESAIVPTTSDPGAFVPGTTGDGGMVLYISDPNVDLSWWQIIVATEGAFDNSNPGANDNFVITEATITVSGSDRSTVTSSNFAPAVFVGFNPLYRGQVNGAVNSPAGIEINDTPLDLFSAYRWSLPTETGGGNFSSVGDYIQVTANFSGHLEGDTNTTFSESVTGRIQIIPEPAAPMLLGLGLLGIFRRRR